MTVVNIHDAKTHFSRLVQRAEAGEEITIARAGTPVARLSALPAAPEEHHRLAGSMRGQIWISDDFDDEDPEITALFEGSVIVPPSPDSDS